MKSNPLFLHHYTSLTRILNRNNVDPPAAKIESSPRLNLKPNQTMGKKPDQGRALTQNLCLLQSISVLHSISSRPTPSPSHLLPPLSPSRTTLHPPSPHSFSPQRQTSSSSSLKHGSETPTLPNPTWALSRLSYIPESSCRRPQRSSISAVCVSQTDRQYHFLPVFSWDCNIDEPWMAFGWK